MLRGRLPVLASAFAALLLVAGSILWLTGGHGLASTSTAAVGSPTATPAASGPNTIKLTGALSMQRAITVTCDVASLPNTYWLSGSYPESKDKDPFQYHYRLTVFIKPYHGAGTYGGPDFSLDVSLSHLAPNPSGDAMPIPDVTYRWADFAGRATVNAGGLTGTVTQTLSVPGSSDRVHMSLSWECLRFGF